jgi:hypothetical protein
VVALSTLLGCVGVVGDPSSETPGWEPVDRPPPPFSPGPSVLPRLTAVQYENVVRDLFGAPVPEVVLEADQNPHLFYNIGASTTTLSGHGTSNYVDAADAITLSLFDGGPRQSALLGCVPESASDACIRGFVAATGRRVFRRPLTSEERARWESVAEQTADGDPIRGARLALFGMLQSPHFLYRTGAGEPDPENPSRRRYTSIEMATRLSFLFWNTTPDEALLAAAERGELVDDADLFEHARIRRLAARCRTSFRSISTWAASLASSAIQPAIPSGHRPWPSRWRRSSDCWSTTSCFAGTGTCASCSRRGAPS